MEYFPVNKLKYFKPETLSFLLSHVTETAVECIKDKVPANDIFLKGALSVLKSLLHTYIMNILELANLKPHGPNKTHISRIICDREENNKIHKLTTTYPKGVMEFHPANLLDVIDVVLRAFIVSIQMKYSECGERFPPDIPTVEYKFRQEIFHDTLQPIIDMYYEPRKPHESLEMTRIGVELKEGSKKQETKPSK